MKKLLCLFLALTFLPFSAFADSQGVTQEWKIQDGVQAGLHVGIGEVLTYEGERYIKVAEENVDASQFLEGVTDTLGGEYLVEIESFAVGLAIGEGIKLIAIPIAKKYGQSVAVKFTAKLVPGLGWAILIGSSAYAIGSNTDLIKQCTFSGSYYDEMVDAYKNSSYFCGKLTVRVAFMVAGGIAANKLSGEALTSWRVNKSSVRVGSVRTFLKTALPQNVQSSLSDLEKSGWVRSWQYSANGSVWANDGRDASMLLPKNLTYTEWDVFKPTSGATRGLERFIRGSDGSTYYTPDHYKTFILIQ